MDCVMTFSEEIRNKKILIWEVNSDSVVTFAMMAFRRIEVEAFISNCLEYVGDTFWNIPIISVEDAVAYCSDSILIVPDEYDIEQIRIPVEKCYYSQALSINERIALTKRNYLYGAGKRGKELFKQLTADNVDVDGFCVSSRIEDSYLDTPILQLEEIEDKDANIIIALYNKGIVAELASKCYKAGFCNIFVDEIVEKDILIYNMFSQLVDNAIKNKKQMVLYTDDLSVMARHIIDVLNMYGIVIERYVHESSSQEFISSVFDLVYEDIEKFFVLINEFDIWQNQKVCDLLDDIGFSLAGHNYVGMQKVTIDFANERDKILDPLLGHSKIYDKYTGIKIYGTEDNDSRKILILGGSTSTDDVFRILAWPKILWRKFRQTGPKVTIYNMAHCGDDCTRELLRLIRDGWYLKPDIIISMSGFNSTYYTTHDHVAGLEHVDDWATRLYPGTNIFGGIPKDESLYDYWRRIEQFINTIAHSLGAEHLCYLQPITMLKEKKTLFEYCCHDDVTRHNEESFRKLARDDDFYRNLLTLFDTREGMYVDKGHYSERANTILADIVYQDVMSVIEGECK